MALRNSKFAYLLKGVKSLLGVGPHLILLGFLLEALTLAVRDWISYPISITVHTQVIISIICLIICLTGMIWFNHTLNLIKVNLLDGENRFITHGPFNYVRHPLYATLLIAIPPLPILWYKDLMFFIPWILLFMLSHCVVVMEERRLVKIFGKEYEDYQSYVPALLPYKGAGGKRFREHDTGAGFETSNDKAR